MSSESKELQEFTVDGLQHPALIPHVTALEGLHPDSPIIDLGCGSGAWLQRLAAAGFKHLTGIEGHPDYFRFHGGARFLAADLMSDSLVPRVHEMFGPESYQLVTLIEVIEHVPNPEKIVQIAASLLKPGGWLLITTPNVYPLRIRLRFLLSGKLHFFDANAATDHTHPLLLGVWERHILSRYPFELHRKWSYPECGSRGMRWFSRWTTRLLGLFLPDELPGDTLCLLLRRRADGA